MRDRSKHHLYAVLQDEFDEVLDLTAPTCLAIIQTGIHNRPRNNRKLLVRKLQVSVLSV